MRAWMMLIVLAACGGGSEPGVDGAPPDPIFSDPDNLVTVMETSYRGETDYTYGGAGARFAGTGGDYLHETMREGSCRLLTSDSSYCVDCNGFCVDGECQDFPTYRQAGSIAITGLASAVTLTWQYGYYNPAQAPLPEDLFGPGDAVTATAPGAEVDGFTVTASGVAPIEPELGGSCASELRLTDGQDTVLSWSDPDPEARVRVWMPSPNNGHGLPSNAVIECEGTDTGSLTIPAALIEAFPALVEADTCSGIACVSIDCPPSTLSRYRSGSAAAGSEQVELRIQSDVVFYLIHD
jgi:hypothetical protein